MAELGKISDRSIRVRREIGYVAKPSCLRERLGRFGYTVAFLAVVITFATLGAVMSMLVAAGHPTVETRGLAPVVLAPSTSATR
jgi:hypothetical protein